MFYKIIYLVSSSDETYKKLNIKSKMLNVESVVNNEARLKADSGLVKSNPSGK